MPERLQSQAGPLVVDRGVSLAGLGRVFRNIWRPAVWILVAGFTAFLILAWNAVVVGVFGFDFEGTYTRVVPKKAIGMAF